MRFTVEPINQHVYTLPHTAFITCNALGGVIACTGAVAGTSGNGGGHNDATTGAATAIGGGGPSSGAVPAICRTSE